MSKENQTKVCKHCQSEIPKKAKVCPQCRKKQGGIMKWVILFVVVIGLIGVLAGGDESEEPATDDAAVEEQQNTAESGAGEQEAEEVSIEYTACTVSEMMEVLEGNALKAESAYQDQYLEITGRLGTIDSDGKYIELLPEDDEWAFMGVTCYIKNDEQKAQVMEMSTGDRVVLKGQITQVGEVLGYSLDIDSIIE